jgi:DDE superfamily endonuclease
MIVHLGDFRIIPMGEAGSLRQALALALSLPGTGSKELNTSCRAGSALQELLILLSEHERAKVEMPTDQTVVELCSITRLRHPLLPDIFAVADGLKLYFQQCDGLDEESMYYNGWKHDHFITNVLVFSIDGRMIATVMNAPGSMHDSTLAEWGGIYEKLESQFTHGQEPSVVLIRHSSLITMTSWLNRPRTSQTRRIVLLYYLNSKPLLCVKQLNGE